MTRCRSSSPAPTSRTCARNSQPSRTKQNGRPCSVCSPRKKQRWTRLVESALRLPFAPVCRVYDNCLLGLGADPTAENAAARKHQRMGAVVIDDGQFQITVERRRGYGLPVHRYMIYPPFADALTYISCCPPAASRRPGMSRTLMPPLSSATATASNSLTSILMMSRGGAARQTDLMRFSQPIRPVDHNRLRSLA